jgi:hypothetical protein
MGWEKLLSVILTLFLYNAQPKDWAGDSRVRVKKKKKRIQRKDEKKKLIFSHTQKGKSYRT